LEPTVKAKMLPFVLPTILRLNQMLYPQCHNHST